MQISVLLGLALLASLRSGEPYPRGRRALAHLHATYTFLRERFMLSRQTERWVSEQRLFDAIVTLFGNADVVRHARPVWLCPQHLDIFLPRHSLAIEYMGLQHYEPVAVFGGPSAFEAMKIRDQRKLELCSRMGIELVFVRHDEDVGIRAREIHATHVPRH